MRRHSLFDSMISLETLDLRLSPSPLTLGAAVASAVHQQVASPFESGDDPPITQPDLPPTGPSGPGSSS